MNDAGASAQAHAVTSGSDALLGMAALGKTAFALLLVVGLIVLCAWLVRRLTPGQANAGQHLKVIASRAVGAKERVVIVELEDTWLVLGVGNGQVSKLHERPAPPAPPSANRDETETEAGGFAARFAQALKHNARTRFGGKDNAP
ncbi:flagellar biosynthetic protein FliO [Alcanivorax sp. N3-2A]|nr:flagellar biosynthetic protein FliO [Alcanivorax sp. N3-2A]|tara:strand:+ start:10134 stop:10568 length:435 start_codon:yes stop_codon:yes gene_type:complete